MKKLNSSFQNFLGNYLKVNLIMLSLFIIQTFELPNYLEGNSRSIKWHGCKFLSFSLDDDIDMYCVYYSQLNRSERINISYENITDYTFFIYDTLEIRNINFQKSLKEMEDLMSRLVFPIESPKISFIDFYNLTAVENYLNISKGISASSTAFYYNWDKYDPNSTLCPWEYESFYNESLIGFDESKWRKACISNIAYLFRYEEPPPVEIIIIPTTSSIIIIVSIIVGIVVFIVCLYFLSLCRCRERCSGLNFEDSSSSF